jgi:hypothetical protein
MLRPYSYSSVYFLLYLSYRNGQAWVCVAGGSTSGRQFGGWLAEAGDAIVSVLFPAGCLCEKLLTRASRVPICEECLASFAVMQGSVGETCGSIPETPFETPATQPEPGGDAGRPVCTVCQTREYGFDRARSYAAYQA